MALGLSMPMFATGSLICRASTSHSCSRPSKVSVKQVGGMADTGAATSRRGFMGLLGALSFSVIEYANEDANAADACDFTIAPSGLGFCDTPGSGSPASQGTLIKANYVGRLENGKIFDSSYDRGKPLTFKIGVGQVIKGWDEGILGGEGVPPMLAGGKRRLKIPPQLGYGDRGAGCRAGSCLIPPNSVLIFDVEFVGKAF
ncbi:hypothetical protein KP509_14G083800 [Ceratopteris richardii]|uniref:peptidylprolyl isomerase n=1 Tax=Ceratopteris richardii TaxID=49495 RepID=A0A8T2TBJ2_CERRI|nr:hypothetical protein KP509_14G083800 [Ceratopteris richardii]